MVEGDLDFSHTFTLNMIVSCQKCENWSKNKLENTDFEMGVYFVLLI